MAGWVVFCALSGPVRASAAKAADEAASEFSLADLELYRGRSVRVTLVGGEQPLEVEGKLRRVRDDELVLGHQGRRYYLPTKRIERVELMPKVRLWGMLAGTVLGSVATAIFFEPGGAGEPGRLERISTAAMAGAAVGAIYDFSRAKDRQVLFERQASRTIPVSGLEARGTPNPAGGEDASAQTGRRR